MTKLEIIKKFNLKGVTLFSSDERILKAIKKKHEEFDKKMWELEHTIPCYGFRIKGAKKAFLIISKKIA